MDPEEVVFWCTAGTPLGEKLSNAMMNCSGAEEEEEEMPAGRKKGGGKKCKKGKKCKGKGKGKGSSILAIRHISSILIGRAPTTLRSHWPRCCRVLKYFPALKGPIIGALSDATPAVLCHKEPARRKNTPY